MERPRAAGSSELVVVGAGLAGLAAALTAAESGLDVVLVEKQRSIGGSSAMSGGHFAFSQTPQQLASGVEDSSELFLRDLLDVGGHVNDEGLLQAYLSHQAATREWLVEHGARFVELTRSSGQSVARSHHCDIRGLLGDLHAAFEKLGGRTLFERRAVELRRSQDGVVYGVVVQGPQGLSCLEAPRGVVLTTGGFSRGVDLLQTFAPDQLNAIPYGGLGNTGDGLRMAWRLGAGMADMGYVVGTYGSHPETSLEFHELLTTYYHGALIVNVHGRRFVDESRSYKVLGRACLAQPHGLGFQIFDSPIRAQSMPGVPLLDIDQIESIGHLFKADSLEELADAAGIDPAGLVSTVQRYNLAIRSREADEMGRLGLCNGIGELAPIERGPFYAYPAKALLTTTFGGITISPEAEVRDVDGGIIPGLFAAGELTGGFHGAAYMTGTSLGKSAVFGRIAALTAAE